MFATRRILPIAFKFSKQKHFYSTNKLFPSWREYHGLIVLTGAGLGGISGGCIGFYIAPTNGDIRTFGGCVENIVSKIVYLIGGTILGASSGTFVFCAYPITLTICVLSAIQWQMNKSTKPDVDKKIE